MAKKPAISNELMALKTVKSFNDLAKRAADKGSETLSLMWKAGETAAKAKENLSHGEWMKFVETHYIVDHSTVARWMQFRATVPEAKLSTVDNLAAGIKMLDPPKPKGTSPAPKSPTKATKLCTVQSLPQKEGVDPFDEAAEADSEAIEPDTTSETPPAEKGRKASGGSKGKPPKQIDREALLKTWTQSIGPLVRQVTRIADSVGEKHGKQHEAVRFHLDKATDIMSEWMGVK